MKSLTTAMIGAALAMGAAGDVAAQSPTQWNRSVRAITVQPNANGSFRVGAYWEYSADDQGQTRDLSTEVDILVNGVLVATDTSEVLAGIAPGGGSCPNPECPQRPSCGTALYNGDLVNLHCHQSYFNNDPDQGGFCSCSGPVCEVVAEVDLQPNDIIEVVVRPAPGSLPEQDASDDIRAHTFDGEARRWKRKIQDVRYEPASGAPRGDSFFDIFVDARAQMQFTGLADMGTVARLYVNGQLAGEDDVLQAIDVLEGCVSAGCDQPCAYFPGDGTTVAGTCIQDFPNDPDLGCFWCTMSATTGPNFEGVELFPGDEVVIVLEPAPGALPELPGLPGQEDDDTWRETFEVCGTCEGDADGDGQVTANDISYVIFRLGTICNPM